MLPSRTPSDAVTHESHQRRPNLTVHVGIMTPACNGGMWPRGACARVQQRLRIYKLFCIAFTVDLFVKNS